MHEIITIICVSIESFLVRVFNWIIWLPLVHTQYLKISIEFFEIKTSTYEKKIVCGPILDLNKKKKSI